MLHNCVVIIHDEYGATFKRETHSSFQKKWCGHFIYDVELKVNFLQNAKKPLIYITATTVEDNVR